MKKYLYSILALLFGVTLVAQVRITEAEAMALVQKNHPAISADKTLLNAQQQLNQVRRIPQPSQLYHSITADPDLGMFGTTTLGVQHSFNNRSSNAAHRTTQTAQIAVSQAELKFTQQQLASQVREIYQHLSYLESKSQLLARLDSLWQRSLVRNQSRYTLGEIGKADLAALQNQAQQVRLELETLKHEIAFDKVVLRQILGVYDDVQPIIEPLKEVNYSLNDTTRLIASAMAQMSAAQIQLAIGNEQQTKAQGKPTPMLGAYGQLLGNGQVFPGWYIGVQAPLARKALKAKNEAAHLQTQASQLQHQATLLELQNQLAHLLHDLEKYEIAIDYYHKHGQALAQELERTAEVQYSSGDSDFSDFLSNIHQAAQVNLRYLDDVLGMRQTIIALDTLLGK
jgi:heavy metal efflux system protein